MRTNAHRWLLAAACCAALVLPGCAKEGATPPGTGAGAAPAGPKAELVVWHAYRGTEKTAFEKVVEAYNAAPAGRKHVTTLAVPYDAYADKITAAVPRGKGPDVFIFAQDHLGS